MIVVADTGPINYLIRIGQIEVLPTLYGRILVPQSVWDELTDTRSPIPVRQCVLSNPVWLDVRAASCLPDVALLAADLDVGERDAILLAEELGANELIIDDMRGRREAERRDLRFIGTLGVLQVASARGPLDITDALARLRQTNFHVSRELLDRFLPGKRT